jgi:hypothetical protein
MHGGLLWKLFVIADVHTSRWLACVLRVADGGGGLSLALAEFKPPTPLQRRSVSLVRVVAGRSDVVAVLVVWAMRWLGLKRSPSPSLREHEEHASTPPTAIPEPQQQQQRQRQSKPKPKAKAKARARPRKK